MQAVTSKYIMGDNWGGQWSYGVLNHLIISSSEPMEKITYAYVNMQGVSSRS